MEKNYDANVDLYIYIYIYEVLTVQNVQKIFFNWKNYWFLPGVPNPCL